MLRATALLLILSCCASSALANDDGAKLFGSTCRPCHDSNGDGKTPAGKRMNIPDLRSNEVQKLSDEDLFQGIGNGVGHKQYPHTFLNKGMTDTQVLQLVAFIRTLKAKN